MKLADKVRRSWRSSLFLLMVATFCLWVLSLPLFPTQDGPMHRYYVHVLGALLGHRTHAYDVYRIRHPFPPYLTHYFVLLALSKLFSWDLAEKVFACGLIACFAYGFRFCAMALGPLGGAVSLCIAPLFLQWSVMMGFMNYALAVALFLVAAGFWLRAASGRGALYWLGFALTVALLTVTHPVPLLVLIGLCGVDLLLRLIRRPSQDARSSWRRYGWRVTALVYSCLAFVLISGSVDPSQSASALADVGFHLPFLKTVSLLTGVSPYNTRSTNFWINAYRLTLYALLAGGFMLAARRFRVAWRERAFSLGDSLFVSAVLLCAALPFTPEHVNGSAYFATRLVALVWVGFLLAACGYRPRSPRLERFLAVFAVIAAVVSLAAANVFLRPVARTLRAIEQQPLPPAQRGLILIDQGLDDHVRYTAQLAPDPYAWAAVLPFVRQEDVALDSPWLDQAILPLAPAPGSPLLIDDIRLTHLSKSDPPAAPGRVLPGGKEHAIVQAADFIVYAGTPSSAARGLATQLAPVEAARFECSAHGWYLVCLSRVHAGSALRAPAPAGKAGR